LSPLAVNAPALLTDETRRQFPCEQVKCWKHSPCKWFFLKNSYEKIYILTQRSHFYTLTLTLALAFKIVLLALMLLDDEDRFLLSSSAMSVLIS
jgi:hypothetical protein